MFIVDEKEGTGFSAWEYSFLAKTTQVNALIVEETINGIPGKLMVRQQNSIFFSSLFVLGDVAFLDLLL